MALDNANLTLCGGEIHALLGENGSGKSTLMHILSGYFSPSSGSILVEGMERNFSATADALALGIGMVRQHPGFVKGFKVWEDCILGAENPPSSRSIFYNPGLLKKRAQELSVRWNFDLPLEAEAASLTVNQRLKAAVLSLLLRDVRWFIFDEPTAVLTAEETRALYELFHRLRNEGKGIILITHKLDEALEVSDRVTIMRHGVTGESHKTEELSSAELKKLIFDSAGQSAVTSQNASGPKHSLADDSASYQSGNNLRPVLEIKNLQIRQQGFPHIRNVSFRLMPGKILGIAGVRDSGLETLELAIAGLLETSHKNADKIEGSILLNGRNITGKGVRSFREAGGAYLGADRLGGSRTGSSLARDLPLSESLVIHAFRRERRGIFLDTAALKSRCLAIMSRAGISRRLSDRADSFSGGMIQRILLAREFSEEPSLLVLAEAGNSLDEANLLKLAEELKVFVSRGSSALLFSTDPGELKSMTDEVLVLRNGTLIGTPDPAGSGIEEAQTPSGSGDKDES